MYGLKTILLAQGVMLFAVPAFAADLKVELDGPVEVSTITEGTEASALVSEADATAAATGRIDAIAACFSGVPEADAIDLKYRVAVDIGGDGKATAVRAIDVVPNPEQTACLDAALKEIALPALSNPAATVTLTFTIKALRGAAEPAKPAELTPVETPAAPITEPVQTDPNATQAGEQPAPVAGETRIAEKVVTPAQPPGEPSTKPWRLTANLTQSLGQGTFVGSNYAFYGYALTLGGSYRIDPKYLSLSARLAMDQELTTTYTTLGTVPREFFIRDLGISASAPELYKDEEFTGIKATAGVGLTFPLSKLSRDQEMILGARVSAGLSRSFENLGPGNLTVSWTTGVRYNVSPAARTYGAGEWATKVHNCDSINQTDKGECLSNLANPRWAFSNAFNVAYDFLDKFSASVDFMISNSIASRLNDSELPAQLRAGVAYDDTHSVNADSGLANRQDIWATNIELSYAIMDNLSVAFGLNTTQNPFIQSDDNSSALRNPIWDFSSEANNLSTFYLDLAATY